MKTSLFPGFRRERSWLGWVVGLSILAVSVASAGRFAEKFRKFVLGPEAAPQEVQEPKLDAVAAGCVRCHNGDKAKLVHVRPAGAPMQFSGSSSVNHSIGADYAACSTKKPQEFRKLNRLDPSIRLVDYKVTCISCHQLKDGLTELSPEEAPISQQSCTASGNFTVELDRDALCLACHIK